MRQQETVQEIFSLLSHSQDSEYIGEPVSQLEHALQAAYFAQKAGADDELILAALLHDIGHLCAPQNADEMDGLGILDHEEIGALFLSQRGLSARVCELIRGHVQAKRYLVYKHQSYTQQLSSASSGTLAWQGGPMNETEANAFEQDPLFQDKLRVRAWDEQAKKENFMVAPLSSYKERLEKHLQDTN